MQKRLADNRGADDGSGDFVAAVTAEPRLQSFGALVLLDAATLRVRRSTTAALQVLGISRKRLFREPFQRLLPPAASRTLIAFQYSAEAFKEAVFTLPRPRSAARCRVPVCLHRRGSLLFLELLHNLPARRVRTPLHDARSAAQLLTDSHHQLAQATTLEQLCQRAAAQVRQLLGFSQVAVLRYESIGAARLQTVTCDTSGGPAAPDSLAAVLPSLADGEEGGRDLVVLADADADPVALSLGDAAPAPLDGLSRLLLSEVPDRWRAQVQALGARALVAVRLRLPDDGQPWGLLLCTDPRPQVPGSDERALLQALAQLLGQQLQILSRQEGNRLTELRVRHAVEASGEPICILDMTGRTVLANAAFAALAGHPAEMLANRYGLEALLLEPGVPERIAAGLLAGGGYWQGETIFRGTNGEAVPIELRVDIIREPGGQPAGYVGVCRDLRPRRRAEETRRQESRRLDSLGTLAAGIAHDFNNLLTGILGNASLLRGEVRRSRQADIYLDRIEETSLRAAELCKQMLAYAGKGQFTVRELSLSTIAAETVPLLDLGLPTHYSVRLQLAPDLPEVRGDAAQLRQALENLVRNGAEAVLRRLAQVAPSARSARSARAARGPAGAGLFAETPGLSSDALTVTTSLVNLDAEALRGTRGNPDAEPGAYVALAVRDSGCGIPPDVQVRMFDPFFTTKPDSRGLGLSTVIGIVRGHGGVLQVDSEIDRGSTFTMFLPVLSPARLDTGELESAVAAAPQSPGGRVLIVDDEEQVRNILGRLLTAAGFTVELFSDGSEAVERVQRSSSEVGLVLLDLTMRRMSGEATLSRLLRLRRDLPIVMMSGYLESELEPHLRALGVSAFLGKPFSPAQVLATVRQALRTH